VKHCTVVFATPERQWLWQVLMPDGATVAEVLAQVRDQASLQVPGIEIPWDAAVGIFGELCDVSAVPRDGDRIELYRPLKSDPKESRRARERARKAAQDRASDRKR
jgi:putative ubiquitin-RnfH superfamily antitoxin RatB of RatAB toxin-antitoxin module